MTALTGGDTEAARSSNDDGRRSVLSILSSLAMGIGLVGGYGMFAALAGRFLLPSRARQREWMFAGVLEAIPSGQSLTYRSPGGQSIVITRLKENGTADDFIALSSVCPHLGCHVHWEEQNERFFCPCHNGAFDAQGNAIAGPPREGGQNLSQFPLKAENGLLFIEVPTTSILADS